MTIYLIEYYIERDWIPRHGVSYSLKEAQEALRRRQRGKEKLLRRVMRVCAYQRVEPEGDILHA
jgi:hypothetical protein